MTVRHGYPCLCVDDIERSCAFYRELLGLVVSADVGWYLELAAELDGPVLLALVTRGHPSVPEGFDDERGGVLISFLVDDVRAVAVAAHGRGQRAVQPCRDEDVGQRHVVFVDPDRFLVDVIERIPPSLAFRRALVEGRKRHRP